MKPIRSHRPAVCASFLLLSVVAAGCATRPLAATPRSGELWAVTLGWTDNSPNETGFEIERRTGVETSTAPWVKVGAVGANVTTYPDTAPPEPQCWRVRAINPYGASGYSNVLCGTGPPVAPGGLIFVMMKQVGVFPTLAACEDARQSYAITEPEITRTLPCTPAPVLRRVTR